MRCRRTLSIALLLVALAAGVVAAGRALNDRAAARAAGPVRIVASSTILADLARAVAGERGAVSALLPAGADPHTYQPVPSDLAALSRADLVVVEGAGLDGWVVRAHAQAGASSPIVAVGQAEAGEPYAGESHEHGAHGHETHARGTRGGGAREVGAGGNEAHDDPHFWFDPVLVKESVGAIARALAEADPAGAAAYRRNAEAYGRRLDELDAWIRERVAALPPERRKLVTNHATLHHFAARYGFEVVGIVHPGSTPEAQGSARHAADLVQRLRDAGIDVIFTENTLSPRLAAAIATEVGPHVQLVPLYTDSLSAAGGPAPTYLEFMRYNVDRIVGALSAPGAR